MIQVIQNSFRSVIVQINCAFLLVVLFSQSFYSQEKWQLKVETGLLDELRAAGTTTFFVYVEGDPDLNEAYNVKDWDERGWFVFTKLTENAERTQAPVRVLLEQLKTSRFVNSYKSYWIVNCIEVEGNLNSIKPIAAMEQVRSIENPQENIIADNQVSSIAEEPFIQNYPNPFNPITQIKYSIVKDGLVTLKVYDVLGREINTLVNEEKQAGTYTVQFDAGNLSSGIYFYSITTRDYYQTKKMIVLK